MKAYPEYKASGIDWLGDIPSHWEMSRVKYVVTYNDEVLPESTDKEQEINYVEISDVSFEKGVEKSTIIKFGEAPSRARRVTKIDDVIISTVRTYLKAIAKIKVDNLIVSTGFAVLHPQLINPHFLFYSLSTSGFLEEVESHSTGVSYPAITATDLVNLSITLPPVAEQEVIAAYLDDVTGKVDALIAEKRKQVEDIRAYRTSLITETVTHGLNPDAPLRPSGINWLGDIPQHWEIIKSSYVFDNIGSGTTPTSGEDLYYEGGSVNWLQTGDLNDGVINSTSKKITPFAVKSKNLKFYNKGSVVIAMYGATIAKLGLLNIQTTVNQACCVLTPSTNIYSKYAFYCFYSAKNELISLASGGGQPNISQATISDFKLPVPPLAEQQAIADFLDAKTAKIDELISELTKQIDELAEYKQAVITEAVTGKVDVCDYKPLI